MNVRLRIQNFGPIRSGYLADGGWMQIPKVALFCGPQGSGKSTVTKLISVLSWLEKTAYRDPELKIDGEAFTQALGWQGIAGYIEPNTEIEYCGDLLRFSYVKGSVSVTEVFDECNPYIVPKISYMPAERNFASIVRAANRVEGLPRPLVDMQVEFERAKKFYAKGYHLPANGFSFEFDSEPWIVNGDGADANKTRLYEASSGLQSMVPLLLVSEYLASHLAKDESNKAMGLFFDPGTAEKKERIDAYVRELRARENLTAEQKRGRLEQYFAPGRRLLNLVEEPEQNLYPEAQCDVTIRLLAIANSIAANQLIVSTHSPYVVNAFVAAQMAAEILSRSNDKATVRDVERIFPVASAMPQEKMALYELSGTGEISLLPTEDGVFSDANLLNSVLGKWNDSFDRLLEIEARLNG